MSHSAELSRRMAQARMSVHHARGSIRAGDTFSRRQSPELRRIPWASPGPRLPVTINWSAVGDGMVVAACLLGAVLIMLGVIP